MEAKGVNGRVTFDGSFVTIHREGLTGRAVFGKGNKRIAVRSISAVQWKPPTFGSRGFVSFTLSGATETNTIKGRPVVHASKDENSVLFARKQQAEFQALVDSIEAAIAAA